MKRQVFQIAIILCSFVLMPLGAGASIILLPGETVSLDANESISVDGSVSVVSSATLDASATGSKVTLSSNWGNLGTVVAGDVSFTGTGASTIFGSSSFRTFTCQTGGKTLSFEAGSTQTITSGLTLSGQSTASKLSLRSTTPGAQFALNLQSGHESVTYLDVKDSNLTTSTILPTNSTDSGNNSDLWLFSIRIAGQVLSGSTSLSGVTVHAGALGTTTTDANGRFAFVDAPYGGTYTLTVAQPGYTFSPASSSGSISNHVTVNFTATAESSTVSGTIEQNGTPIEGATVTIEAGGSSQSSTTNESGEYSFTNVPTGEGTISAEKGGTTLLEEEITVTPGATEPEVEIENTGLTSPAVTFWNGFLGIVNVLELVNTSTTKAEPQVVLYDLHGSVLSTTVFAVEAGSQRDVIVNDLAGFSTTSYGIVSVVSSDNPMDGRISYYISGEGGWGVEYDLVFSLPFFNPHRGASHAIYNSFNPSKNAEDQKYLVPTWLSVANLGTTTETFDIQYRGQDGSEIATAELRIPPHGKRDIQAGHEFSGSAAVGLVTVTPPNPATPYVATVTRYGRKAEEGRYGYGFGVPTRSGNSSRMVLPASNAGQFNAVELVNTVNNTNAVSLTWYDQNGSELHSETKSLPAYGQQHLITSTILPDGASGSLLIDGASPVIAGSASYFYDASTGEVLSATYIEASEAFGRVMSGTYNTYLDMTNWLRVINLSDSAQDVTIDYGTSSDSILLPAHARQDITIASSASSTFGEYGSFTLQSNTSGVLSSSVVRVRSGDAGYDFMSVSPVR